MDAVVVDVRPSLVIVTEPMVSSDAVQMKFVSSIATSLTKWFKVAIASTYVTGDAREQLTAGGFQVLAPQRDHYWANRVLKRLARRSESTLWAEAWIREALFGWNRALLARLLEGSHFDFVVNTTNTAVLPSDVWWIQGPPLYITLESMVQGNGGGSLPNRLFRGMIRRLEDRNISRLYGASHTCVAASRYVRGYYESHGFTVRDTIYNVSDLSAFRPVPKADGTRYVLAYIGKETEVETLNRLVDRDIKVIAFGGKLVPGLHLERLRRRIDFRGRVNHDELVSLYSGAEFTAFPFTNEPLGYVPLESMACGTPVLTYGRQGPAETVVNGETGWLAHDPEDFEQQASDLWHGFERERFSCMALQRVARFGPDSQAQLLATILLDRGRPRDAPSGPTPT